MFKRKIDDKNKNKQQEPESEQKNEQEPEPKNEKKCEVCGCTLQNTITIGKHQKEIDFGVDVGGLVSPIIFEKYGNRGLSHVDTFFCPNCGKISFYLSEEKKSTGGAISAIENALRLFFATK